MLVQIMHSNSCLVWLCLKKKKEKVLIITETVSDICAAETNSIWSPNLMWTQSFLVRWRNSDFSLRPDLHTYLLHALSKVMVRSRCRSIDGGQINTNKMTGNTAAASALLRHELKPWPTGYEKDLRIDLNVQPCCSMPSISHLRQRLKCLQNTPAHGGEPSQLARAYRVVTISQGVVTLSLPCPFRRGQTRATPAWAARWQVEGAERTRQWLHYLCFAAPLSRRFSSSLPSRCLFLAPFPLWLFSSSNSARPKLDDRRRRASSSARLEGCRLWKKRSCSLWHNSALQNHLQKKGVAVELHGLRFEWEAESGNCKIVKQRSTSCQALVALCQSQLL